jgi:uncharacterized membrane protein YeaQ/YmgE (transglycosylase-associated protein family)
MILPLANIGAVGLYLLFAWLLSAIAGSWLSGRAGYGERIGLGTGLLLTVVGAVIWLVIYAFFPRPHSRRATEGFLPARHTERRSVAEG